MAASVVMLLLSRINDDDNDDTTTPTYSKWQEIPNKVKFPKCRKRYMMAKIWRKIYRFNLFIFILKYQFKFQK